LYDVASLYNIPSLSTAVLNAVDHVFLVSFCNVLT
jgi:hypothetical protein